MAEEQEQQMRMDVADAAPEFSADEIAVSHSPLRVILDFKSVTPRLDMHGQQPRHVLKHTIVRLDPHLAREFMNILKQNLEKYEKQYGKIERPAAIRKAEAARKKTKKAARQDYFG